METLQGSFRMRRDLRSTSFEEHPACGRISGPFQFGSVPFQWDLRRRTGTGEATYNSNSSLIYETVLDVCNVLKRFGKVNTEFSRY